MDILSDGRLLIINYVGLFLFVLKVLGVWVGIGYSWLICMIIWQLVIILSGAGLFLLILGILSINNAYSNIKKRFKSNGKDNKR